MRPAIDPIARDVGFAEAEVREPNVPVGVQKDVLRFQIPKKRGRETSRTGVSGGGGWGALFFMAVALLPTDTQRCACGGPPERTGFPPRTIWRESARIFPFSTRRKALLRPCSPPPGKAERKDKSSKKVSQGTREKAATREW